VTLKAWTAMCKRALDLGPLLIKVKGIDTALKSTDPQREIFSPVVTVAVDK